jgi:sugar phosphate isomerase/epimerase
MRTWIVCLFCCGGSVGLLAQRAAAVPEVGIVHRLDHDSLLAAQGFAYLTDATPRILSPRTVSEEEFARLLPEINSSALPLYACNLFMPGDLKVVGPEVNERAVLDYVEVVLRRAGEAGVSVITWGSSGSRSVPEGYSYTTATAQFIYMAGRIARVAERYGVTLVLENLNRTEANFITTLREALAVVRAVEHPNLRLCVDLYHMLVNGEPASDIVGVGAYAVYAEIAEREDRTPPGTRGDDFRPYLKALRAEGYSGPILIEARWGDEVAETGGPAYRELTRQLGEAYAR